MEKEVAERGGLKGKEEREEKGQMQKGRTEN